MYEGVSAEMDIANDPPEGLIFHLGGRGGRQMDRHGPGQRPQPTVTEFAVHNYVKP
jgi:hypothetical protein